MAAIDAGMNIAEVEDLSRMLAAAARSLEGNRAELERLVGKAAWRGADAERFRQSWWPQHRSFLAKAIAEIERLAAAARSNASDQRQASEENAAGALGGAAVVTVAGGLTLREILRMPKDQQAAKWAELTPAERSRLIRGKEGSLGELDLVAPEIRYAANRQLMFEQWEAVRAKGMHHLSGSDLERLELYTWLLRDNHQVLFFDPSGDGRIAVVNGDLAHARHIAVSVPGISTNLDTFGGMVLNSDRLQRLAPDSAVVSWLGYDAPVGVGLNPIRNLDEIPNQVLAHAGADALVGFVKGVREINPGADVTVIGHSYGSLVTGLAAQHELNADNVVFIGSPGVGVDSVRDFALPQGAQVYAAAPGGSIHVGGVSFGGDGVSNLGRNVHPFGGVPTDPAFGVHVLDIGERANPLGSHSDYFKEGSVSLQRLASIVNGNGGAL